MVCSMVSSVRGSNDTVSVSPYGSPPADDDRTAVAPTEGPLGGDLEDGSLQLDGSLHQCSGKRECLHTSARW